MRPTRERRSGAAAGVRVANEITMDELPAEWRVAGDAAPMGKYRNRKVIIGDQTFASQKEANRYSQLRMLEKGGVISRLTVHPRFQLEINRMRIGAYTADFRYIDEHGNWVIEDVKSNATKTTAYQLRKRLMKALYGVEIKET